MIGKTARCRKQRIVTFQRRRGHISTFRLSALTKRGGQAPCPPKPAERAKAAGYVETLGVSRQAVSKWESGENDPSTSNLIALAKLYGTTVEEILKSIRRE